MGAPSYLLKKKDKYYFRQACPSALQGIFNKREIIKSLGVKDRSLALRMAREFKVNLDNVIDGLMSSQPNDSAITSNYLNDSLVRIKGKYGLKRIPCAQNDKSSPSLMAVSESPAPPQPLPSKFIVEDNQPSALSKKTKIDILFEKYSSKKIRLKQWSPKTFKERTGHFLRKNPVHSPDDAKGCKVERPCGKDTEDG